MIPHSLMLSERLLAGQHLLPSDLDDLINRRVREDVYLEYKHGNILQKKEASTIVQEYATGFANSAGVSSS